MMSQVTEYHQHANPFNTRRGQTMTELIPDADAAVALSLVENCVRNSDMLEWLHTGTYPSSEVGDYSDVKVISPYGEIPWAQLSRISDEEMRTLIKEIVNKVYTWLLFTEELSLIQSAHKWDKPELDATFMGVVKKKTKGP